MFLTGTFLWIMISTVLGTFVAEENIVSFTYMTPEMLSQRLPYSTRHIREYLKDRIFIEGYHYVRTPGGRRLLFIWERVEEVLNGDATAPDRIPLAAGGFLNA